MNAPKPFDLAADFERLKPAALGAALGVEPVILARAFSRDWTRAGGDLPAARETCKNLQWIAAQAGALAGDERTVTHATQAI